MQQYPRLKVEDALSYLDRVKQQFCSHPHVYNDFLDIMKEFKSQTIDTPGVITRVSSLFQGHKDLIVGFNTFLPPGYKIELNKATDTINIFQPGHRGGTPTHMSLSNFETIHSNKDTSKEETNINEINSNSSGKPVEFNHAIHYVNKIKSRYQNRPEIYKSFLEILHHYQKDDKNKDDINIGSVKLTETEVLSKVAMLFKDQPDLLKEFGQFLPDAAITTSNPHQDNLMTLCSSTISKKVKPQSTMVPIPHQRRKRISSIGSSNSVTSKKVKQETKASKDFISEIGKCGSLLDFAFFDKVRKMLGDVTYMEFLKCLKLYCITDLHMSSTELMQMIQPFCMKMPELKRRIKDLMRKKNDNGLGISAVTSMTSITLTPSIKRSTRDRSILGEFAGEIDYASCKRLDVSYLAIPRGHIPPKCSGRTPLCHEVLNDTYVSFPSWSEDSSSVIKKTMAEEQLFKCEEDRCQLDVVLDNFVSTCELMMLVQAKMDRMSADEASNFTLDNYLGGRSEFLHRKTLLRLYGEKGNTVIEALKQSPLVVVPIVINRLKSKIEEWRDARQHNARNWNEINQRYYLKSLDHQGLTIKQTDVKILRSKSLLSDIEAAFLKRQEHGLCEGGCEALYSIVYSGDEEGGYMELMGDVAILIIHHVKRQTNINSNEKRKMKQFLHCFLPDLLYATRGQLSDDEGDNDFEVDGEKKDKKEDRVSPNLSSCKDHSPLQQTNKSSVFIGNIQADEESNRSVFYANSHFFVFLRLHCILCDRLGHLKNKARIIAVQQQQENNIPSVAQAIHLKAPSIVNYNSLYVELLRMIGNLMDGLIDAATYEEQLREMFVTDACIVYTIDKLIHTIVRQLQHLVSDESCLQLFELFRSEQEDLMLKGAHSHANTLEIIYQHRAIQALYVDEKCFKFITTRGTSRVDVDMLCGRSDDDMPIAVKSWVDDVASWIPINPSFKKTPAFLNRNISDVDLNLIEYAMKFEGKVKGDGEDQLDDIENPRDVFVFRKLKRNHLSRTLATSTKRSKKFGNFISSRLQLSENTSNNTIRNNN